MNWRRGVFVLKLSNVSQRGTHLKGHSNSDWVTGQHLPIWRVLQVEDSSVGLCTEVHGIRGRAHGRIKPCHGTEMIPRGVYKRPPADCPLANPREQRVAGARAPAPRACPAVHLELPAALRLGAPAARPRRGWSAGAPVFISLPLPQRLRAVARLFRAHCCTNVAGGSVLRLTQPHPPAVCGQALDLRARPSCNVCRSRLNIH